MIAGGSDSDEDKLKKWQDYYNFKYEGKLNDWALKIEKNDEEYVQYFCDKWKYEEKVIEKPQ